ncbi:FAD-binding oxidoreductase [Spirillospora sp. NPDC029432]|uniref:FAD-binding oxidoreductase n=1 Tax=Spirillospora sp. NPDC029432 TaxID=3154599 RepID=UPI003451E56A
MNEQSNALSVDGPVFRPEDGGYDEERTGYQLLSPHRAAVIVGATSAEDVRAAVAYAAGNGLKVAVQASGHGLAGALEGGVLITTGRMSGVRVDPAARTAWIEAGAKWEQVVAAAAPHGLAPPAGSAPSVGAVSYTLGGGVGLLARRHGFAADHVRRFEIVTADGRLREVTAESDPDLFWALRGGGGNFGAVTGVEIGLFPVESVYAGVLHFDVGQVPDVLDGWRRWTATVPEETTSGVAMLVYPHLPMIPEPLRGRHVAQIQIFHLGTPEDGERLVEPLRALGPLMRDSLRERPLAEAGEAFEEPVRPHAYRSDNRLVTGLSPAALAGLVKAAGPSAPVMCVVGLRHLGGALARPPADPGPVGHRDAAYLVSVLSPVEPGEERTARDLHREALAPFEDAALGRSLNFAFGPLDEDQVRTAYAPGDYRRLTELKARYDGGVLFHANHAIPPR